MRKFHMEPLGPYLCSGATSPPHKVTVLSQADQLEGHSHHALTGCQVPSCAALQALCECPTAGSPVPTSSCQEPGDQEPQVLD